MAVSSTRVSVGTSPTPLTPTSPNDDVAGQSLAIRNPAGGASVYLGGPGVTTATGFELAAGESLSLELAPRDALLGIVATGTVAVHVMQVGV